MAINTVKRRHERGVAGQVFQADPRLIHTDTFEIGQDRTAGAYAITVLGSAAGEYSFLVGGELVRYDSTGGETAAQIAAKLLLVAVGNGIASANFAYTASGNTITASERMPGGNTSISASVPAVSVAHTPGFGGASIPFGRMCLHDPLNPGRVGLPNASIPASTYTATVTFEDGIDMEWALSVGGASYSGSVTMATSAAASATALATALNALNGVSATAASGVVTVVESAPGSGVQFAVGTPGATTGGVLVENTVGGLNLETDLAGISKHTYTEDGIPAYKPGRSIELCLTADVYVEDGSAANLRSPVLLGTAAGEEGRLYSEPGAGRINIPRSLGLSWVKPNVIRIKRGF